MRRPQPFRQPWMQWESMGNGTVECFLATHSPQLGWMWKETNSWVSLLCQLCNCVLKPGRQPVTPSPHQPLSSPNLWEECDVFASKYWFSYDHMCVCVGVCLPAEFSHYYKYGGGVSECRVCCTHSIVSKKNESKERTEGENQTVTHIRPLSTTISLILPSVLKLVTIFCLENKRSTVAQRKMAFWPVLGLEVKNLLCEVGWGFFTPWHCTNLVLARRKQQPVALS